MTKSVIAGLMLVAVYAVQAADVYVAADGKDTNPGTKAKPLASFAGARDAVRKLIAKGMKQDLVVQFAPGNYFTKAVTTFDERDSGRDGHTVIYRGAPDCGTRIYGGLPVTGWKKEGDHYVEGVDVIITRKNV